MRCQQTRAAFFCRVADLLHMMAAASAANRGGTAQPKMCQGMWPAAVDDCLRALQQLQPMDWSASPQFAVAAEHVLEAYGCLLAAACRECDDTLQQRTGTVTRLHAASPLVGIAKTLQWCLVKPFLLRRAVRIAPLEAVARFIELIASAATTMAPASVLSCHTAAGQECPAVALLLHMLLLRLPFTVEQLPWLRGWFENPQTAAAPFQAEVFRAWEVSAMRAQQLLSTWQDLVTSQQFARGLLEAICRLGLLMPCGPTLPPSPAALLHNLSEDARELDRQLLKVVAHLTAPPQPVAPAAAASALAALEFMSEAHAAHTPSTWMEQLMAEANAFKQEAHGSRRGGVQLPSEDLGTLRTKAAALTTLFVRGLECAKAHGMSVSSQLTDMAFAAASALYHLAETELRAMQTAVRTGAATVARHDWTAHLQAAQILAALQGHGNAGNQITAKSAVVLCTAVRGLSFLPELLSVAMLPPLRLACPIIVAGVQQSDAVGELLRQVSKATLQYGGKSSNARRPVTLRYIC